jgi:hypothetical protein
MPRSLSLPAWVAVGSLAGIVAGLVFGQRASVLFPIGSNPGLLCIAAARQSRQPLKQPRLQASMASALLVFAGSVPG